MSTNTMMHVVHIGSVHAACALSALLLSGPLRGATIDSAVFESVVQIVGPPNAAGEMPSGTGILIGVPAPSGSGKPYSAYLVTNKHVLGDWNPADGDVKPVFSYIELRAYKKTPDAKGPYLPVKVSLTRQDGSLDTARVALHTLPTIDVAAVRIDDILRGQLGLSVTLLDIGYLQSFSELPGGFANVGDIVFALGYPRGVTSVLTNRPVAKVGHLAASAGQELALATKWRTRAGKEVELVVRGKLILIDGLIVPGNSGGPVVLPCAGGFGTDPATGRVQIRTGGPSRIIGIVSSVLGPSGLAYAYSADYLKEVIEALSAAQPAAPNPKGVEKSPSHAGNAAVLGLQRLQEDAVALGSHVSANDWTAWTSTDGSR